MNEILFLIGDWPVRTVDALIGFGALALILLLTIAVVIAFFAWLFFLRRSRSGSALPAEHPEID